MDDIQALGVNVIWLMPIFPMGKVKSVGSPYCVQDYLAVDPEFGTMNDLKTLVEEAHKRGMAVILDWVANHTAWDHPWLADPSWYTQVGGEVISPAGTGWADVADLNYNNPDMRQAMIGALTYWVEETNIDGFRFDAADLVPFDFWKQAIDILNAIPGRDLILLAEGMRGDHYQAGFQMTYAWDYYQALKSVFDGQPATLLYTTHLAEYRDLAPGQEKLRFTTNHDESAWDATPVVLFNGKDGALAASLITMYMGGVPMLYGSQEIGAARTVSFFERTPVDWGQNPDMLQFYQQMLAFHADSLALLEGALEDCSSRDVVCFRRIASEEEVLVIVNVRQSRVSFEPSPVLAAETWVDAFSAASVRMDVPLFLDGNEFLVLQNVK
jgi:glycosidase